MKKLVMVFGTFDKIHAWHEDFLNQAKKYGNFLVAVIARDTNVIRFKSKPPVNDELTRQQNLQKLWIADEVLLWDENNPYLLISQHKPDVICIWYDQNSFNDLLADFLHKNWFKTKVQTLKPYFPDKYKSSKI